MASIMWSMYAIGVLSALAIQTQAAAPVTASQFASGQDYTEYLAQTQALKSALDKHQQRTGKVRT